jgi:hypothetical protein
MSNNIKNKKFTRKKRRKHNKYKSRKHKQEKYKTKKQKGGLINTGKIFMNWIRGKKSDESEKKDKFKESLKKGFWAGLGSNANDSKQDKKKNLAHEIFF